MKRDFSLHFAAWFLVGAPFVLFAGFALKPVRSWFGANATPGEVFFYCFTGLLFGSLICALFDVFVVGGIVSRMKKNVH
jgi:hypothetical protein